MAVAIGCAAGLLSYVLLTLTGPWLQASDFTYWWLAARELVMGAEPYAALRHARLPWQSLFTYPLPAALVVLPIAWLPAKIAGGIFVATGFGLLAYALSATGYWRMGVLLSGPAVQAIVSLQWSPLITAAAFWPLGLGIMAAKPTVGLALLAYQKRMGDAVRACLVALALVLIALAVDRGWIEYWLTMAFDPSLAGEHAIPLLHPLGWILGLTLLRWRRPEARLVFVLALVPQKLFFYEQLPLLLVPETKRELGVAVLISEIAYSLALRFPWTIGDPGAITARCLPYVMIGLYWPALAMVLRRPNEGPAPAWVDRILMKTPQWIRGTYSGAGS